MRRQLQTYFSQKQRQSNPVVGGIYDKPVLYWIFLRFFLFSIIQRCKESEYILGADVNFMLSFKDSY